MNRIASCVLSTVLAVVAVAPAAAQKQAPAKADQPYVSGDYLFKPIPFSNGGMVQVFDKATNRGVGTIVNGNASGYTPEGTKALQAAYDAHQSGGGQTVTPTPGLAGNVATTTSASSILFDQASKSLTVPMDDGATIVFNSNQTITVQGGGIKFPGQTYTVEEQKASVSGTLRALSPFGGTKVSAGGAGSLVGKGPKITNGGGKVVYDDVKGTVYAGQNNLAKAIAVEITAAKTRIEQEDPKHSDMLPKNLLQQVQVLTDLR